MRVPLGKKLFSHVRPDESWDGIRDMLSTTEQISVKERKFRHVDLDSYTKRTKKRKTRVLEKLNVDIDSEEAKVVDSEVVEANTKDPQTVCSNESPSQKFLMEFLK